MGLGPLVGTRTWGGVVGIQTVRPLVDGTFVTQPQVAFWFRDTGWGVENYGTDPTIESDNTPVDFATRTDRQLDRTIDEALRLLKDAKMLEEP
jgi:tricorn protease